MILTEELFLKFVNDKCSTCNYNHNKRTQHKSIRCSRVGGSNKLLTPDLLFSSEDDLCYFKKDYFNPTIENQSNFCNCMSFVKYCFKLDTVHGDKVNYKCSILKRYTDNESYMPVEFNDLSKLRVLCPAYEGLAQNLDEVEKRKRYEELVMTKLKELKEKHREFIARQEETNRIINILNKEFNIFSEI